MSFYNKPHQISAFQAKFEALKLSFAPVVFQASYALLKLGVLAELSKHGEAGATAPVIAQNLNLSEYGVKVLLDVGLSCHLVWLKNEETYILDKIGTFLLSDHMIQVNFDFIQDVCYQSLYFLLDSVKTGKAEGLQVFGDWKTIYPALSSLPPQAKSSWFNFDHYYSDKAFPHVLSLIFAQPIKTLMDIGGNTGKWALQCLHYSPEVVVTIVDLPQQLSIATENIRLEGFSSRLNTYAADMLQANVVLPIGQEVIWMSQFLDCFAEAEILTILKNVAKAMTLNTTLYILELFWDRQSFEPAAFSINCTSIYFTALANGNSRMYHSKDLIKLLHQANLYVDNDIDEIGAGHTLLCCKKKPN